MQEVRVCSEVSLRRHQGHERAGMPRCGIGSLALFIAPFFAVGAKWHSGSRYSSSDSAYSSSDSTYSSTDTFYISTSSMCYPDRISDGYCDSWNNKEECDYDGGDCCTCTCIDGASYNCGYGGFLCLDPSSSCFDPLAASCTGDLTLVGDGECDSDVNNEGCGYDGGDCCECTNTVYSTLSSSSVEFNCTDPDGAGNEVHECKESPPAAPPCPTERRREWVVENTTQARELAEAIDCSGGAFKVEWNGTIIVNKTIYVGYGTVLNITGVGPGAAIDGGGTTRLFTVENASLHVRDVNISNGDAIVGGAIAASRSNLNFSQTWFIGNAASNKGGALFVSDESSAFFDRQTGFFNNTASLGGGVYLAGESNVFFNGQTGFFNNAASLVGGGVYMEGGSSASWEGKTNFSGNTVAFMESWGGAVCMDRDSSASWAGETTFSGNAAINGGAVYIGGRSYASWAGETIFSKNTGQQYGGAVAMDGSSASWAGETTFSGNTGGTGGGVSMDSGSYASWAGETTFVGNTVHSGGGVSMWGGSDASWAGETIFSGNTAYEGGGLYATDVSHALCGGKTNFSGNVAVEGGGVYVGQGSDASWEGETTFLNNTANRSGGAVFVGSGSSASWSADTVFRNNAANSGGAMVVADGSTVEWSGETNFMSNSAVLNGGAVASTAPDSSYITSSYSGDYFLSSYDFTYSTSTSSESRLVVGATTNFVGNTCGANGGGLALLGGLSVVFRTTNVLFSGNNASVAGGGVFISATGKGPVFSNMSFIFNWAQTGGGVYVTGSGTAVGRYQRTYPTTFDGCRFIRNVAGATGGGVESAAGMDVFNNTLFARNTARVGGALRLAGVASLNNCTFEENISDLDEGPAVSNIGFISDMRNCTFLGNVFDCENGTFLGYDGPGNMFDVICDGCNVQGCNGENNSNVCEELEEIPTCASVMEHCRSPGGTTTVEELTIDKGYWRTTNTSRDVLECYNKKACPGGVTSGSCNPGYQGPYCSVCSEGYMANPRFTCVKCADSILTIVFAVVVAVVGVVVGVAVVFYLVAGEVEASGRGVVDRVKPYVPLQSVKIVIVAWQILTQFSTMANVVYPKVYQRFLDIVNILSFDMGWILSAGCLVDVDVDFDFHDRLLVSTIGPVVVMGLLGVTYAIAVRKNRGSEEALRNVRHKHMSAVLLVTFLVYSSVSSVLFRMFPCESLDDGSTCLRADYSIECDQEHKVLKVYASVMIALYPLGVPAFYAVLLFRNRDVLKDRASREGEDDSLIVKSTSELWKPYKPSRFYYEVIECGRRILLTGVILIGDDKDTAAQIAVTLLMAFLFVVLLEVLAPYESPWETWVSRMAHAIVFTSMYLALLLKVDVSNENMPSQKAFGAVLVAVHACMLLAVMLETLVMACSLTMQQRDEPRRRICRANLNSGVAC